MTQLDPLPGVQIGAREIYDELKTVGGKVDKVDGKVDQLDSKVDGVVAEVADHETRIRVLERARWPLPSIAVLISVAGFVATFVMKGG
ncbi:hypothetical protein [Nonomuraea sp. bgisy101]|uniref:hypothetical protein n=1 Tax=Nonomuraea sp. bgisy101 TaxID=3413784 RepID=UPI003D72FAF3